MGTLRASAILICFFVFTLPLMPTQAAFVRFWPRGARLFPHWYHRQVCRILGVTLDIDGEVAKDRPVLLVSNHTSWLDIPVFSALAPVSFVAKKEVGRWPFVSALARLQRTVFVDRTRRQAAGEAADEIMARLSSGDVIVLFAEGTSSDGGRVLPFKTSLFGAVKRPNSGRRASRRRADRSDRLHPSSWHTRRSRRSAAHRLVRRHGNDVARLAAPEERAAQSANQGRAAGAARSICRPQGAGVERRTAGEARRMRHSAWTQRR